jgi:hypothetical protein
MAAEPNVVGIARLAYVVAGIAAACWALWGADPGWTKMAWLTLGGLTMVLGIIGYSPLHALIRTKNQKAG